jgi:hypothetical protein
MSERRAKFDLYRRYRGTEGLRAAMVLDPILRAEAEAELAAINGIDKDRSVVAGEYADFLRKALAAPLSSPNLLLETVVREQDPATAESFP